MNQLHITLEENSPAIKWANTQADRIGARGHVGTHLDCYTTVPEKPEYNITAMVLDCQIVNLSGLLYVMFSLSSYLTKRILNFSKVTLLL